jgi:hypothetical protein
MHEQEKPARPICHNSHNTKTQKNRNAKVKFEDSTVGGPTNN